MQFEIEDKELERTQRWVDTHECKYWDAYVGAIGGLTTHSFTPTYLGTKVELKCACGAYTDVTDYSAW